MKGPARGKPKTAKDSATGASTDSATGASAKTNGSARGRPKPAMDPATGGSAGSATGASNIAYALVDGTDAHPGTLLHRFFQEKANGGFSDENAAAHISKWTTPLLRGAEAFEAALLKEQRKIQQMPLVFGMIRGGDLLLNKRFLFETNFPCKACSPLFWFT
jgi:hypothetical protein